jgi:polysaccharide export outer membrane protein
MMHILGSNYSAWVRFSAAARRNTLTVLLGLLLFGFSGACQAQTQQPPVIPISQGGGQTNGRLQSLQGSTGGAGSIGALTDEPIVPGQTVHVMVFDAPDFSTVMQVSANGDIAVPVVGAMHVEGLNSLKAEQLIEARLKELNLVRDPHVTVTVDAPDTGVTVLGEVHSPGIYQVGGKHLLSDLLAAAGGLTANTGRVIEISNDRTPDKTLDLHWDPTMHDTRHYDYPIHSGDRIYVRPCGIAYVGGHVSKPGAYSLCGSPIMTLSEVIAMAGGAVPFTSEKRTYLIRTLADGSRVVMQIDLHRVLTAREADPAVHEDDIIYVTPSPLKAALSQAVTFAMATTSTVLYVYH